MRSSNSTLAIAAVISAVAAPLAYADQAPTDSKGYMFSQAYYVKQDSERAVFDDDGQGFRLGFGGQIQDHWFWETNLAYDVLETGVTGYTDYYQLHLGFDAVYRFGSDTGARPFLLVGIGAVRDDVFPSLVGKPDEDKTSFFSNIGAGIVSPELFNVGLKLRFDARAVFSEFHDGYQDQHYSIGFEVPLGGTRVVQTTVVKEVVREVPVAPIDTDGDGVVDSLDKCADTLKGARVDSNGCAEKAQTFKLEGVNFLSGSDQLTAESIENLSDVAAFLNAQPELRVELAGHTDAQGSAILNMQLSQKRADAVKNFLVRAGISPSRMRAVGYGETSPVATNTTSGGRAQNRRVEFKIFN